MEFSGNLQFVYGRLIPPGLFKIQIGDAVQVQEQTFQRQGWNPGRPAGNGVIGSVRGGNGGTDGGNGVVVFVPGIPDGNGDIHVQPFFHHFVPFKYGIIDHFPGQFFHKYFVDTACISADMDVHVFSAEIQRRQGIGIIFTGGFCSCICRLCIGGSSVGTRGIRRIGRTGGEQRRAQKQCGKQKRKLFFHTEFSLQKYHSSDVFSVAQRRELVNILLFVCT